MLGTDKGARAGGAFAIRSAAVAYLVFACLVSVANILFILRHFTKYPFGDYWTWLERLYKNGLLATLFMQFNEHRLVVPGIFYFLDHRYLGAQNVFLVILYLALQIACIALLIIPIWRHLAQRARFPRRHLDGEPNGFRRRGVPVLRGSWRDVAWPVRIIFVGFTITAMMWFIQAEDFFYPYQLSIICAVFGILVTIELFTRLSDWPNLSGRKRLSLLAGVIGFGLWASFSFGNGLLVWPVMLAMGLCLAMPRPAILAILAVFAVVLALYFLGYRTPSLHARPLASLTGKPLKVFWYLIVMLGLPFFGPGAGDVGLVSRLGCYLATASGMLLAVAFILRAALARRRRDAAGLFYSSLLLVIMGSAFITALGRVSFPIPQALSGRYSPVILVFWISLAALITIELSVWEAEGGLGRAMWCAMMILASTATLSARAPLGDYMANRERLQQAAAISLAVGAPDRQRIQEQLSLYDRVLFVDRSASRWMGHSMFARPESRLLGTPLWSHFGPAAASDCDGAFDSASILPGISPPGARLTGWAWDKHDSRRPKQVWVTDDQMIIRGFGVTGILRADVAGAFHEDARKYSGWLAYAPVPAQGSGALKVYAELNRGGQVCQIGAPRTPTP